jgi:hypothetical protein
MGDGQAEPVMLLREQLQGGVVVPGGGLQVTPVVGEATQGVVGVGLPDPVMGLPEQAQRRPIALQRRVNVTAGGRFLPLSQVPAA